MDRCVEGSNRRIDSTESPTNSTRTGDCLRLPETHPGCRRATRTRRARPPGPDARSRPARESRRARGGRSRRPAADRRIVVRIDSGAAAGASAPVRTQRRRAPCPEPQRGARAHAPTPHGSAAPCRGRDRPDRTEAVARRAQPPRPAAPPATTGRTAHRWWRSRSRHRSEAEYNRITSREPCAAAATASALAGGVRPEYARARPVRSVLAIALLSSERTEREVTVDTAGFGPR